MTVRRVTAAALVVVAVVLAGSDLAHWRASRRGVSRVDSAGRREAVVVLGFGNRGNRANLINRYRVRAALRSRSRDAAESVLVLCGGAVAGPVPEADLLAAHARELGHAGPVLLDRRSRTTWQNIENAIPLIEDADVIKIVSNSLHAEEARAYLRAQRPDLGERLARAQDHRFGEILAAKPFALLRAMRRAVSGAP